MSRTTHKRQLNESHQESWVDPENKAMWVLTTTGPDQADVINEN